MTAHWLALWLSFQPLAPQQTASPPDAPARAPGVAARFYHLGQAVDRLPILISERVPTYRKIFPVIDLKERDDFLPMLNQFVTIVAGAVKIEKPGRYAFRLISDDGAKFWIDNKLLIDHDGLHGPTPKDGALELAAGFHPFRLQHFDNGGGKQLTLQWKPPGASADAPFVLVPAEALFHAADEPSTVAPSAQFFIPAPGGNPPGDGAPLAGVHPGFDLTDLHPAGFEPRIGGMDFLSDGRLVVCTYGNPGAVYILSNVSGDPAQVTVKEFATGLAEPLGLCVVNDEIFVLQSHELTQLVDANHDGVADEKRRVAGGWPVVASTNQRAYGLVHKDGFFYAALDMATGPDGRTLRPQVAGRGTVLKINPREKTFEYFAGGVRFPNGLGLGPDGELFVPESVGDWAPAARFMHAQKDAFLGARTLPSGPFEQHVEQMPAVWLPPGELCDAPAAPTFISKGPYAGQMLCGDLLDGGLVRMFLEKANGEYQGCAFRFSRGLDAGIGRLVWGPDGALYVGGLGLPGHASREEKKTSGLYRLKPNGKSVFEMLAVRVKTNGLEIEFTEPLAAHLGWEPQKYLVQQWFYKPSGQYGGPKMKPQTLPVKSASVSDDRRRVFLEIDKLPLRQVVYLRLLGKWASETGQPLWSTEAWYALNNVLRDNPGQVRPAPANVSDQNQLTDAEKAAGWRLLFDGRSLDGWHTYGQKKTPDGWRVMDGCLVREFGGGDLSTADEFDNFELTLEWAISEGGNSGILYRVNEELKYPWETGPEMQVLDNAKHADGRNPLTSAGSDYALYAPPRDVTKPVGEFNQARLVMNGPHVEHWLNGEKIVEYELWSDDWKARVAGSKFKDMPRYGLEKKGRIVLQDHGDRVWYRNIKVRPVTKQ